VAQVGGTDAITQIHVVNLLRANGIVARIPGGSVEYDVLTDRRDVSRGAALLRRDAERRGYFIRIDGESVRRGMSNRSNTISLPVLLPYGQARKALGQYLSCDLAKVLAVKKLRDISRDSPFVIAVNVREQQYLDDKFRFRMGYEVGVEMGKWPKEDHWLGSEVSFYVLDSGKGVADVVMGR